MDQPTASMQQIDMESYPPSSSDSSSVLYTASYWEFVPETEFQEPPNDEDDVEKEVVPCEKDGSALLSIDLLKSENINNSIYMVPDKYDGEKSEPHENSEDEVTSPFSIRRGRRRFRSQLRREPKVPIKRKNHSFK